MACNSFSGSLWFFVAGSAQSLPFSSVLFLEFSMAFFVMIVMSAKDGIFDFGFFCLQHQHKLCSVLEHAWYRPRGLGATPSGVHGVEANYTNI